MSIATCQQNTEIYNIQVCQQDAQQSLRHPRDALFQIKHWPTVVQITQTDRMSAREAL